MISPGKDLQFTCAKGSTKSKNVKIIVNDRDMKALKAHAYLKFSAVFGTTSAKSSKVMRPESFPSILISKKTVGFDMIAAIVACDRLFCRLPQVLSTASLRSYPYSKHHIIMGNV